MPASLDSPSLGWQLFENSPDCVKLLSEDGRILAMNRQGQCIMEIDEFAKVAGMPWKAFWPPASHGEIDAAIAAAVGGGTGAFQAPCPTAKGKPAWWDVVITRLADVAGQPGTLLAVSRDITAARQAQHQLQASEARFRALVAASSTIAWYGSYSGSFDSEQPAWAAFTGQAFAQHGGMGWLDAVHPGDRAPTMTAWTGAVDSRSTFRMRQRLRRADGEYRHMDAKAVPVFDAEGAILEWVGVHVDVSAEVEAAAERRLADIALFESRERFRKIVSQAATGVIEMDTTGRIVFVNQKYADMLGYAPAELVGRSALDVTAPDSVADTTATIDKLVRDGVEAVIDKHYLRKDGSLMPATSSVNAVRGPDGEVQGLVAIVLDITESRRASELQRQLADDLIEVDRRRTEFLATLAHELRNPLAPIRSGLAVLRLSGDSPAAVARVRDIMERQVGHMVHLIDDLLDIARISGGKLELKKSRVDLAEVMASAIETSLPMIEASRHALRVDLAPEPLPADVDVTRIAQVVANLLNNAAKYTPVGGRIVLALRREGAEALVSVQDTGVGIPAAALDSVFDMFSQVGRDIDRSQGGLGIGLSLVRRLVEMHGGSVTGQSAGPGAGSTFTVRLPLALDAAEGEAPAAARNNAAAGQAPAAMRVMVVDDNVDAAETLAMIVALGGHAARIAHDGVEAIEVARDFLPRLVFLDIGMPRMNGYDAASALRRMPGMEEAMLVALTGWGTEGDRNQSSDAGFDRHLTKPVQMAEIERILADAGSRER